MTKLSRVLLGAALFLAPSIVLSQTSQGILSGVARDTTGALLPNAKVTITNEETGEVRTGATKTDGSYRIDGIPPGHYTVSIEEPGFETRLAKGVIVNPSVVSSYDAT